MKPVASHKTLLILAMAVMAGAFIIIAHELSHYLSALALGLKPKLFAMSVQTGAIRPRHQAITIAAGPMIEFALTTIGYFLLYQFRKNVPNEPLSNKEWGAFIIGLACLRWVLQPMLSWTLPNRAGIGLTDEHKISYILGLPSIVIPVVAIAFGWIMIFLLLRLHSSGTRRRALLLTIPSMALGAYLWAQIIGPLTLGLTSPSTTPASQARTQPPTAAGPVM